MLGRIQLAFGPCMVYIPCIPEGPKDPFWYALMCFSNLEITNLEF